MFVCKMLGHILKLICMRICLTLGKVTLTSNCDKKRVSNLMRRCDFKTSSDRFCVHYMPLAYFIRDVNRRNFTITAEILVRSLANVHCQ